jgi:hypothetical protein
LLADTNVWHGISAIAGRGFFSTEKREMYRLFDPMAFKDSPTQTLFHIQDIDLSSPILDALLVKYVVVPEKGPDAYSNKYFSTKYPTFREVFHGDHVIILQRYTDRAFVTEMKDCSYDKVRSHTNKYPVFQSIPENQIIAYCRSQTQSITALRTSITGDLNLNKLLHIKITNASGQFLVLPYSFSKDMSVRINGKKIEPLVAYNDLLAVKVKERVHDITLLYEPAYLDSRFLFLFFLLVGGLLSLVFVINRRKEVGGV